MRIQTGQFVGHRFVVLVLGLLLTFAGGVVADTYYIAADGNDDNSATLASPFGTFDYVIRVAKRALHAKPTSACWVFPSFLWEKGWCSC